MTYKPKNINCSYLVTYEKNIYIQTDYIRASFSADTIIFKLFIDIFKLFIFILKITNCTKMKIQSVILFGFLGVIGFFSYSEAKRYSNVDLQLKNMFLPTLDCYLGRRTCNNEDYHAKQFIADKLTHNCYKCDASMKKKLDQQFDVFYRFFHEDFLLLVEKYSVPSILECLLQNGPCSPTLKTVKTILPHYLKYNGCPGCSDEFKKKIFKRFDYLRRHHPKEWRKIVQKYSRQ